MWAALFLMRGGGMASGKFEYWLTEDGLTLLKGYARRGLNDEQIAAKMHIVPSTLYEWKKRFPEISEALKDGKDLPDIKMENALYEAGINGNVTAMIFWLKNRLKGEWKDKPVEDQQTAALETAMRALADIIEKPVQSRNIEDFEK